MAPVTTNPDASVVCMHKVDILEGYCASGMRVHLWDSGQLALCITHGAAAVLSLCALLSPMSPSNAQLQLHTYKWWINQVSQIPLHRQFPDKSCCLQPKTCCQHLSAFASIQLLMRGELLDTVDTSLSGVVATVLCNYEDMHL